MKIEDFCGVLLSYWLRREMKKESGPEKKRYLERQEIDYR